MFVDSPLLGANVLILTDVRFTGDAHEDTVLANWKPGLKVWGRAWGGVARAALWNPGTKPTSEDRAKAREELKAFLLRRKFHRIVVLETQSQQARKVYNEDEAAADHAGTVVWDFFSPPAPISEMAGTLWQTEYGLVMPLLNYRNRDWVYGGVIFEWLRWIRDGYEPVTAQQHITEPGVPMRRQLQDYLKQVRAGRPLTLDIENVEGSPIITVVGLSDGETSVSVPWHPFVPFGTQSLEPGFRDEVEGQLVIECLRECELIIGHNLLEHDLPILLADGVATKGQVFDTYLASGVVFSQFRHGLQQCVSYEFPVHPWKTLFRAAQKARTGLVESVPEFWLSFPEHQRLYNGEDAFHNHLLAYPYHQRIFGRKL
jgi:hypothetical protein